MTIFTPGKITRPLVKVILYTLLGFLFILAVLPIYLMLVNATRSTEEIQQGLSLLPSTQLMYNWNTLTNRGFNIIQGFINSCIVAFSATILSVYFSALTAYGFYMYEFKGKNWLWTIILVIIMIPPQLGLIGFYKFMAQLHLLDNYIPLIVPAIAAPSTVLFIRQYFKSILSKELVDAARIDGSSEFFTFNTIVLPITIPALATMAIFTFVGNWNNFITPYILISDRAKYTLPMLVQQLRTDIYRTEFGGVYLGIAITIVPILIFYAFMSKYIISGITMGGVKE